MAEPTIIDLTTPSPVVLNVSVPQASVLELKTARDGKSAYQIWLEQGNTGTEADFITSLKGEQGNDGNDGTNGNDGKSAYQIWLEQGNTGTEADFITSLKGEQGNDGTDGQDGRGIVSITQPSGPTTALVNYTSGTPNTLTLPAGPAGNNGTNGNDGKTVLSGNGVPSAGLGINGDFYINTAAWTIYGPKTDLAWGSPTSLIGPASPNEHNNPNVLNKPEQFDVLNTQEWTASVGGGANAPDIITPSDTQETGCLRFRASTADTATSTIVKANNAVVSVNGDALLNIKFRLPILPDGTEDFIQMFGLYSGSAAGANGGNTTLFQNQIAMRVIRSGGNVVMQCLCRSANVMTSITDTTALAANTTYCVQINKTSTGVTFWLNGVQIGSISTNVPTGYLIPISRLSKILGSTLRTVEQYSFHQRYARTTTINYAQL